MIQKLLSALLLLCFVGSLAACNTMAGLGQDIGLVGDKTENAANRNR